MCKHHANFELHRARVSNSMIMNQLKPPKSTVYDTVARFKQLGDDKDRPRSGCPRTARTISNSILKMIECWQRNVIISLNI